MTQTLNNIMAKNIITIEATQSVKEAAALMQQHNIGSIPVIQNGQLAGIITDRDITIRTTSQGLDANTPVSSCMSSNIVAGNSSMSVHEAAQLMAQNQIRRLPVVENNQIVGMVALGDLATIQEYQNEAGQALTNISVHDNLR
ncbi:MULTISPECIES: CBS domain-containing protein [unclassified Sutcliffiella]|uniref:CBS domain-containing protein n=1 Tax=unclassified Sutcliffiella TaxID=2837532 RepID=UPI0030CEFADB